MTHPHSHPRRPRRLWPQVSPLWLADAPDKLRAQADSMDTVDTKDAAQDGRPVPTELRVWANTIERLPGLLAGVFILGMLWGFILRGFLR